MWAQTHFIGFELVMCKMATSLIHIHKVFVLHLASIKNFVNLMQKWRRLRPTKLSEEVFKFRAVLHSFGSSPVSPVYMVLFARCYFFFFILAVPNTQVALYNL